LRTNVYRVPSSSAGTVYGHDANGNLTSKVDGSGSWTYEWNPQNQLVRVTRDGLEVAHFTYDPLGRRVRKVTAGVTYSYVYSGMDILQEAVAAATYRYVHGPGIDEPLARIDAATNAVEYYHADGLGSVVRTTNSAGAVVSSRQYDAWGNPEFAADQADFAFTGREWDPETGLHYYRARYYDSRIGRFLSEDPIGFGGGANFYAYVGNAPATAVDPMGLQWSPPRDAGGNISAVPPYNYDSWSDFGAGFGDNVTFGLTGLARKALGSDTFVDRCGGAYSVGQWAGVAWSVAFGSTAGATAAGTRGAGREFSHWIPTRMGGPRSVFNGNYVSAARHYLHDPFRYPPGWRALGDKWPAALQQLDRVPNVFKGTAAGAAYGGASVAANDCKCQ